MIVRIGEMDWIAAELFIAVLEVTMFIVVSIDWGVAHFVSLFGKTLEFYWLVLVDLIEIFLWYI